MSDLVRIKEELTSFRIITLGFVGVILLGAMLLMLPISSQRGEITTFGNALFTATSAVCVTGLVVYDTATYWSYFGQTVILILIQVGGLGVISVASFFSMIAGKKISLMQRQTMQNALSAPQVGGIVKLTRFIFLTSFTIEGIGALLLFPVFVPRYGLKGIWLSVFHSISAFCNAGFDLMGDKTGKFSSLTTFSGNVYLNMVVCILIILGGMGFLTWRDIATKKTRLKEYKMQTKVILVTTIILIFVPAILFFFVEFYDNPLEKRICMSIFQAVTPRTAGFNTADLSKMSDAGKTMTMILMLIGGSPGSTAGGMKTTTFTVLILNAIATFRSQENAGAFGRRLEYHVIKNAATIAMLYFTLFFCGGVAISVYEGLPLLDCLYEAASAVGTVGLTLGVTPGLHVFSQVVLIILMYLGRVGGLTLIYAVFSGRNKGNAKLPLEKITVG